MMKRIDLEKYRRREIFEAFKDRDIPYVSVTSNVDITNLKAYIDAHGLKFFVSITFLLSKSVNLVPEFRHRIIDGELFEYEIIDPSYTVLLDDETFSFCDSRHFDTFAEYKVHTESKIREAKESPDRSVKDKSHMFFITSVPWFSFTSVVHPYDKKYGSIPIIAIGKYFKQDGRLLAPIGLQAHHGLMDGIHMGKFYNHLSTMCHSPAEWLE